MFLLVISRGKSMKITLKRKIIANNSYATSYKKTVTSYKTTVISYIPLILNVLSIQKFYSFYIGKKKKKQ